MSINKHTFFCRDLDCEKEVEMSGKACEDHETDSTSECPGCGMDLYVGANGYCSHCWVERFGTEAHVCSGEWDYERGIRVCDDRDHSSCPQYAAADGWCPECDTYPVVLPNICERCQQKCKCDGGDKPCASCIRYRTDKAEEEIWCGVGEPECECDGSGRMCDFCAEEYKEQCRGCGSYEHLWTDNTYCRECYVKNYGDEFPKTVRVSDELKTELLANLPAEGDKWSFTAAPRHTSLESMRAEIAEIEARLKTNMTKHQKDDWIWLLQNRRGDLAAAEKEMWEGYDEDDLRKLDLQLRR